MTNLHGRRAPSPGDILTADFLHDLRTPLSQIIGYSEMLVEATTTEGQAEGLADLQHIVRAARQMLALLSPGSALPDDGTASDLDSAPAVIPLPSPVPEPAAAAAIQPASAGPQALILVVDDNAMNRDLLARRLEQQDYAVAFAENGEQALASVRAQAFDLILLDILMPDIDGYTVLKQLKADAALRHIPVIMVSRLDKLDSVVRCIEMGAEDYLLQPINPTLLRARIGACLERKRARDRELQLFAQLEHNYKRLKEAEQARDDLTHMIIHDLRTPVSSMMTAMQALDGAGDINEIQQEIIDIALNNGKMLLGMISDLLDVEKMESGSMQLDYAPLNAPDLLAVAVAHVTSLVQGKHLHLIRPSVADLPTFDGDATKLVRILVNLLDNAIKFTPPGGTVTVAARASVDQQGVLFYVKDTGEGIPSSSFEHIFQKFGQVESRRAGREMSTGLGLTFCKLAVTAHGGNIAVESALGSGSTFSFTVPLKRQTLTLSS